LRDHERRLGGVATSVSRDLKRVAQRVADALPPRVVEEVVLTGSVSRGVADEVSDIEMLLVSTAPLGLQDCFELAEAAGLQELDTWGVQEGSARRVSGRISSVPIELIWWPRTFAETQVDRLLAGELGSTADALTHGIALRTTGMLAAWQDRLGIYPPQLAAAQIEDAALPWGGFTPAGLLTLIRPDDRLALVEWMLDGGLRVQTIVFALNRVWRPTTKRFAARVASLAIKPDRLAERMADALTEPDPRRALRVMTELQLDAVLLAPDRPNVERARSWLAAALEILGR
jgi:predicted nucleotidyltransferase